MASKHVRSVVQPSWAIFASIRNQVSFFLYLFGENTFVCYFILLHIMCSVKVSLGLLVDERTCVFHWTLISILLNICHERRHRRSLGDILLTRSTNLESLIWREIYPHGQCLKLCIIQRENSIDKGNIASLLRVEILPFLVIVVECRLFWLMTQAVNDTTSFEKGRTFPFSWVFICVTFSYPPSLPQNDPHYHRFIHHDAIEK